MARHVSFILLIISILGILMLGGQLEALRQPVSGPVQASNPPVVSKARMPSSISKAEASYDGEELIIEPLN